MYSILYIKCIYIYIILGVGANECGSGKHRSSMMSLLPTLFGDITGVVMYG